MFGLFKKKDKTIKRIVASCALGYSITIEVGTGTDYIIYRYYLQSRSLDPITKTYPEITQEIYARLQQADPIIEEYANLAKINDAVEAKVFRGLLSKEEQVEEYKKLNHQQKKLENAIKRVITATNKEGEYSKQYYKGRPFKLRIHRREQEERS